MLCDFKRSTEAVGLGIHPDKTKILSNQATGKRKEVTIDNIRIEVLQKSDCARYLGQQITFEEQETAEVKNRLKAAWAAFHKYRQELTRLRFKSSRALDFACLNEFCPLTDMTEPPNLMEAADGSTEWCRLEPKLLRVTYTFVIETTEPPDLMEVTDGSTELCRLEPKWLRVTHT